MTPSRIRWAAVAANAAWAVVSVVHGQAIGALLAGVVLGMLVAVQMWAKLDPKQAAAERELERALKRNRDAKVSKLT